jgi:hypothetical protein
VTVADLIEKLRDAPPDADVWVWDNESVRGPFQPDGGEVTTVWRDALFGVWRTGPVRGWAYKPAKTRTVFLLDD